MAKEIPRELEILVSNEQFMSDVGELTETPERYYRYNQSLIDMESSIRIGRKFDPDDIEDRYLVRAETAQDARGQLERTIEARVASLTSDELERLALELGPAQADDLAIRMKPRSKALLSSSPIKEVSRAYTSAAAEGYKEMLFWAKECNDISLLMAYLRLLEDPALAQNFLKTFWASPRYFTGYSTNISATMQREYAHNQEIQEAKDLVRKHIGQKAVAETAGKRLLQSVLGVVTLRRHRERQAILEELGKISKLEPVVQRIFKATVAAASIEE